MEGKDKQLEKIVTLWINQVEKSVSEECPSAKYNIYFYPILDSFSDIFIKNILPRLKEHFKETCDIKMMEYSMILDKFLSTEIRRQIDREGGGCSLYLTMSPKIFPQ